MSGRSSYWQPSSHDVRSGDWTQPADRIIEFFNIFSHENYGSYVTSENSAAYGQPVQNVAVEYQPRMMQLGFRFVF